MPENNILLCEVCDKNEPVGVACVPCVPISVRYCRECLDANAHPYGIVVANTAALGGEEFAADFWLDMIECTLKHLGKTRQEFDIDLTAALKNLEEYDCGE